MLTQYRRKDGTRILVNTYVSAIVGDEAKERYFLATTIDVTARKLAEDALRATQADLARVTRMTTMGAMTASIAHEINQPLAAIVTNGNAGLRWLKNPSPDIEEVRAGLREEPVRAVRMDEAEDSGGSPGDVDDAASGAKDAEGGCVGAAGQAKQRWDGAG